MKKFYLPKTFKEQTLPRDQNGEVTQWYRNDWRDFSVPNKVLEDLFQLLLRKGRVEIANVDKFGDVFLPWYTKNGMFWDELVSMYRLFIANEFGKTLPEACHIVDRLIDSYELVGDYYTATPKGSKYIIWSITRRQLEKRFKNKA